MSSAFEKWISDPQLLLDSGRERGAARMGWYAALAEVERMVEEELKALNLMYSINKEGRLAEGNYLLFKIRAMKEGKG
jgi:hypothetical protein